MDEKILNYRDQLLQYLIDGIIEEISNALVKVNNLEVTSRTSVFGYKRNNGYIGQIAKELNVATTLEGCVGKAGN